MVNLHVVRVNKKEGREDEATQRKVPLPTAAALLRLLLLLSEGVRTLVQLGERRGATPGLPRELSSGG